MRRLLLFLLLLAALDAGLGALLGRGFARVRTGASGGLANQAIAVGAPLLILGSSRAQHHLDPAILGPAAGLPAWNAGADGQGVAYACALLDLIERRAPPRLILWNLDRKDFDPAERKRQLQRLSVLLPHYGDSGRLRSLWRSQGYEARLKVQVRSYRFNSLVLPMLGSLFEPAPSGDGFVPIPPRRDGATLLAEPQVYAEPDAFTLGLLESTLVQASRRGTDVVLLTTPRWSPGEPPASFYDAIDARFAAIAATLPRVVFWRMDEAALPEFRDATLFVDAGHLNTDGAARLSRRIADRLASGIRPEPPHP